MAKHNSTSFTPSGCLSRIGLMALVAIGALMAGVLTMLLPPWVKVKSQRQQVLYWSQRVKDDESTFAGYHWLFAGNEWQTEKTQLLAAPSAVRVDVAPCLIDVGLIDHRFHQRLWKQTQGWFLDRRRRRTVLADC